MRSTTSCSAARHSARSSTPSQTFAASPQTVPRPARPRSRRSPRRSSDSFRICRHTSRHARSPSGCSCPAAPSTRKSARSIGSWESPHAPPPFNKRRPSASSADSGPYQPGGHSKTSSVSYPNANASLGAAATTHGNPTTGMTPTRTSTISSDRRAGAHRGVGVRAVGGHGTADRDQRGETHERQRLRIELPASNVGAGHVVLCRTFVVDGQATQPFSGVHSIHGRHLSLGPAALPCRGRSAPRSRPHRSSPRPAPTADGPERGRSWRSS